MLLEFSVGNFLSFKERKTLSLEASSIRENQGSVIEKGPYKVLRSAVIYGANSSGKSNLIKALTVMRQLVIESVTTNSTSELPVTSFLLSTDYENRPSFFEILFIIEDTRYRYGFEVDKFAVHAEWLFEQKKGKEHQLFLRDRDKIEISEGFSEGRDIVEKTRENALFLSIVDQFNGPTSKSIISWFSKNLHVLSGLTHESEKDFTSLFVESKDLKTWINEFLEPLDLGFYDFAVLESKKKEVVTYHNKYDPDGNIVAKQQFDLISQESAGTNKLYDMSGWLTYKLKLGGTLIIDELDAKLHPLLTMAIVKLFNSPLHNRKNSQLVFATHDTNLLNHDCFRRDQIFFTEKNRTDETDLYSLVEYREANGAKIRNDRSFEKDYITGRYGAIPFIGDFAKLFEDGAS
jgi:AAA15 family ATPase/GTPase